jgi:hypothetical protein
LRKPLAPPLPWQTYEEMLAPVEAAAPPVRFAVLPAPPAHPAVEVGPAQSDPQTSAMWSNWVELNPAAASRLGVAPGDLVEVSSSRGSVRAPAVITPGIAPDVVAMPVGQGHETFTRYASGRGSNPLAILAPLTEPETGALAWAATRVRVTRVADGRGELILFAGSDDEHPHEHR